MKRVIITTVLIFVFITIGTIIAAYYAKGYRFFPDKTDIFQGTGILVASSKPEGARVYIDDHLTTATDNTLNLAPGEYTVRIEKDGYFTWKKKIIVKKELVSEANATLFPLAPKLEAVTTTGANNPVIDNSGTFLAFTTSSISTQKNGIYILDMNSKPIITIGGIISQLADNTSAFFSSGLLSFSPENNQLIATVPASLAPGAPRVTTYLLSAKGFNDNPQDITATLAQVQKEWEKQSLDRHRKILDALPRPVRALALSYFKDFKVSSDDDRIIYTASQSATLPIIKKPRLQAVNSTPEDRNIKESNVYVYDTKEDRNYLLFDATKLEAGENLPHLLWHPDSRHIFFIQDKKIHVEEFDGQNRTVIYGGPFVDNVIYPWPDGTSIVILNNFNVTDAPTNLYRISLK